jgi:hypothetical protein
LYPALFPRFFLPFARLILFVRSNYIGIIRYYDKVSRRSSANNS